MHKSVLTFGLLVSSLVMLSVMPLFNNNNAAMAQEYDKYGDSSYSKYPTDDKKYECRTGPFEGFFVSSVEFCKHVKFDDKRMMIIIEQEHKVHPAQQAHLVILEHQEHQEHQEQQEQEEQHGEPGATGATGEPGAPGLQNINASNYYSVPGETRFAEATNFFIL